MAGCRAPALHVCIPGGWWCIPGGWWCSMVAGGASWHPRPHIEAGHPGRGTHPLLSAAALSLKWVPLRIFFNRLLLYLSII